MSEEINKSYGIREKRINELISKIGSFENAFEISKKVGSSIVRNRLREYNKNIYEYYLKEAIRQRNINNNKYNKNKRCIA